MRHTLIAWMEDKPGVLNRVASLFRRRNFNIESLAVGHTEAPGISRMTVVVNGDDRIVQQVERQLFKLINVTAVQNVTNTASVVRELALIKVRAVADTRSEIMQLVNIYRAKIVDVCTDAVIVEITGPEAKIDSFIDLVQQFGIQEIVRTGRVAMIRGNGLSRSAGG
jgi:acetolactate synthase-1/3 small subunit